MISEPDLAGTSTGYGKTLILTEAELDGSRKNFGRWSFEEGTNSQPRRKSLRAIYGAAEAARLQSLTFCFSLYLRAAPALRWTKVGVFQQAAKPRAEKKL